MFKVNKMKCYCLNYTSEWKIQKQAKISKKSSEKEKKNDCLIF